MAIGDIGYTTGDINATAIGDIYDRGLEVPYSFSAVCDIIVMAPNQKRIASYHGSLMNRTHKEYEWEKESF